MGFLNTIFKKRSKKKNDTDLVEEIRQKLSSYEKTEGKASFSGSKVLGVMADVEVIESLDGTEAIEFYAKIR